MRKSVYFERHQKMISYQEKIKPFTPTMRELMDIFNIHSTAAVSNSLRRMADMGLVVTRSVNNKTYYCAVGQVKS